jgi:hypothetical protein
MATAEEREAWFASALALVPQEGQLGQGAFYGTLEMWLTNALSDPSIRIGRCGRRSSGL